MLQPHLFEASPLIFGQAYTLREAVESLGIGWPNGFALFERVENFGRDQGNTTAVWRGEDESLCADGERWALAWQELVSEQQLAAPITKLIDGSLVACPGCGDTTLHLAAVETGQGDVSSHSSENRVNVWRHEVPQGSRGASATIRTSCEHCDEVFDSHLQFHKGSIQVSTKRVEGLNGTNVSEMWRD